MPKRKTLRQLVDEEYNNPEVAQAVYDHAHEVGTVARIEKGELVLPSEQDATNWHDRLTGRAGMTTTEKDQESRIRDLEQLVADLMGAAKAGNKQAAAMLEQVAPEKS